MAKNIIINKTPKDTKLILKLNNNENIASHLKTFYNEENEKLKNLPLKVYNKNVPKSMNNNLQNSFIFKKNSINDFSNLSPEQNMSKYKPNSIIIDQFEKNIYSKVYNSRSINPKITNNKKENVVRERTNRLYTEVDVLYQNQATNTNLKNKQKINSKSTSNDSSIGRNVDKLGNRLFSLKKVSVNKQLNTSNYNDKIKNEHFACYTINNPILVQEKLKKFCNSYNMTYKEVDY